MLGRVVAETPAILARFTRRSDAEPVLRAAIEGDIVYVPLAAPPPAGRHTLQLWVGDELLASLTAEAVGSGRSGEYPLRVRPQKPEHLAELERLVEPRASDPGGAVPRPRPSRASIPDTDAEPTIPSARAVHPGDAEDKTLTSRTSAVVEPPGSAPEPRAVEEAPKTTSAPAPAPVSSPTRQRKPDEESLTLPRAAFVPPPKEDDDLDARTNEMLEMRSAPRAVHVSWNVRVSPTTKDPLCGRAIASGKYVLDGVIGTGAIGIVFKASHRDLGRTVAIKVLNPRWRDDPDLLDVFRTEARAASQLEHPNVARVYDYGQEPDGLVYIVMEYLSGYTLGSVLSSRRRLTRARALDVMVQVCGALSAAHDRGIIHRDVKPDNIVIVPAQDDEGRPALIVKVCDFGIAALETKVAETGSAAGTPEYMAPEQQTGGAVTPAADVYACGVLLYQLIVGQVPFTDPQAYRVLLKHANEPPERPSAIVPDLEPGLEAVILRALEKQPSRRFQTARELRIELRKYAEPRG
jgi:serine/threonine-protein kinase